MFQHPKLEEVLEEVRTQKLEGKTLVKISHELARKFPRTHWETSHVIKCLAVLRERGALPPSPLQDNHPGRGQYHDLLERTALRANSKQPG